MDKDDDKFTTEEFKPPQRREKQVAVRVVKQEGESALVQLADGRRVFIPASEVKDDKCAESVLGAGIPYGVPWEDILEVPKLTPVKLAEHLRRAGFYTSADIEQAVKRTDKVVKLAFGIHAGGLHSAAKQYEEANK